MIRHAERHASPRTDCRGRLEPRAPPHWIAPLLGRPKDGRQPPLLDSRNVPLVLFRSDRVELTGTTRVVDNLDSACRASGRWSYEP